MSRRRSLWLLPAAVLATTALAGTPVLAQDDPTELEIGFVPSVEAGALVEDIQPLADWLEADLDMPVTGVVSSSYPALVEALRANQTQIGALPPLGLVQAVDIADAEVILQSVRFGSPTYHTQFMTNNPEKYCTDEPVTNDRREEGEMLPYLNCNGTDRAFDGSPIGPIALEALENVEEGDTVAFINPGSSSGYIFPATIFANMGLNPEEGALNALFAQEHTNSVIAICEGQAEVGVSYDDARPDATTECDVANEVVVFAYGPEIANDGMAVAGQLSDELTAAIKQSLLDYAATDDGAEVLDRIYNINALAEPNIDSLQLIRDAVDALGYGQE